MKNFFEALKSDKKSIAIPEKFNYFEKLIGSWQIDYFDSNISNRIKGEWHFSWVLEGMAIQDVIILPDYEYGTSLRIYNPNKHTWDVAYGYTGKIIRLEAKKQDGKIVLTFIDDEKRKWVFIEIDADRVPADGWEMIRSHPASLRPPSKHQRFSISSCRPRSFNSSMKRAV